MKSYSENQIVIFHPQVNSNTFAEAFTGKDENEFNRYATGI